MSILLSACGGGGSDPGSDGGSTPTDPVDPGTPGSPTASVDPVNGFLSTPAPIDHAFFNDGASAISILLANGTVATTNTIDVGGRTRRYLLIRQTAAPSNAPLLVLLHPSITSPEEMANLTEVSDYVLTQGFVAVLPEAIGGTWDQDPSRARNEDLPFISALIDSLVANNSVDSSRVYAAGFSDGGFMTERLACQLSDKIAAFGIDAATLRATLASSCEPATRRSKIYFHGTADLVVAYNGLLPGTANGLYSAEGTQDYWAAQQGCGGVVANTLPDLANDGTTVVQSIRTGCSGGTALQLFTINGGGHAWPGGAPSFTGLTTQDIQATGLIWRFVRDARR